MDILIQPALVGCLVAAKDILYDEYLPESPHVWVDVGIHAVASLIATGVTMEFLVPEIGDAARVVANPVIHGGLSGLAKEHFVDTESVSRFAYANPTSRNPPSYFYTFENGFFEGLAYGSIPTAALYALGV